MRYGPYARTPRYMTLKFDLYQFGVKNNVNLYEASHTCGVFSEDNQFHLFQNAIQRYYVWAFSYKWQLRLESFSLALYNYGQGNCIKAWKLFAKLCNPWNVTGASQYIYNLLGAINKLAGISNACYRCWSWQDFGIQEKQDRHRGNFRFSLCQNVNHKW